MWVCTMFIPNDEQNDYAVLCCFASTDAGTLEFFIVWLIVMSFSQEKMPRALKGIKC